MTSIGHAPLLVADPAIARRAGACSAATAEQQALTAEWRPFAALEPIVEEWRTLAARALEPNVFYEPAFARPAAAVFGDGVGAILVWSGACPRELLGFFPARIESRRYGIKLPVLVGWIHPYGPLGTPLIARGMEQPVIAAWLAHLAGDAGLPRFLLLPFVAEDGPFAAAFGAVLACAAMPVAAFNRHRRALLAPTGDRLRYVEHALGARKHRELRRLRRRLNELGATSFTNATERAAVGEAFDDFLALEAGGWKGAAGTAAACHDDISRFIRTALVDLADERKVEIRRILVDGRPVAAAITLRSGDGAWFWKTAYDEQFSRYSPGVLIAAALTDDLNKDAAVARTDSCAAAGHPIMEQIWCERLALGDLLVAVKPQAPFEHVRRLERLRRTTIEAAKSIRRIGAAGSIFRSRQHLETPHE